MPKYGTLNIHYSLLPKYRGASPVQSAILNNEQETGVTIQKMVKELDAGPIIGSERLEIGSEIKTPELLKKLVVVGANLLVKILPDYVEGKIQPKEQTGEPSVCAKIKKEDGLIAEEDLRKSASDPRLSVMLYNKFRAFYEWPRTYFFKDDKRFIITDAELENGKFVIKKILPEGRKETAYLG